jgi:hypothetical protein
MNAGEIIKNINGLTHDKLTYFVRSGYIKPVKIKRGSLYYNEFSDSDLETIKTAWNYIMKYDTTVRSAFERAAKEKNNSQPSLFESA